MNDTSDAERAALTAGYQVVQALTVLAGALVAISGLSAGAGYFFYFGYLSTIGAPWLRDMLSVATLIQYGGMLVLLLASVTLVAMLKFSSSSLPRIRFVLAAWTVLMLSGAIALAYTKWSFVLFAMQVTSGIAAVLILPIVIIRAVRAWQGRTIGVVAMLTYVIGIGTLVPLAFGMSKAFAERARPHSLSVVVLSNSSAGEDWRLVLALNDQLLITRNVKGTAFREFKLVEPDDVRVIRSFELALHGRHDGKPAFQKNQANPCKTGFARPTL